MTRKRLNRNKQWFFQYYPYFQMRMENELFTGLVSLIQLTDGEYLYWDFLPQAGKAAVAGKGMVWLQMIPDRGIKSLRPGRRRLLHIWMSIRRYTIM